LERLTMRLAVDQVEQTALGVRPKPAEVFVASQRVLRAHVVSGREARSR